MGTFQEYWDTVTGGLSREEIFEEFEIDREDRDGVNDWLDAAEQETKPEGASEHRERALDLLCASDEEFAIHTACQEARSAVEHFAATIADEESSPWDLVESSHDLTSSMISSVSNPQALMTWLATALVSLTYYASESADTPEAAATAAKGLIDAIVGKVDLTETEE